MNSKLKSNLRKAAELGIVFTFLTTLILVGCGGGSTPAATTPEATTSATITPYKGPFASGATVTIKDANGIAVTTGTVNANGTVSVTYNQSVTYPLLVEVTGNYYNEVSGLTENTAVPLRSLITNAAAATNVPVTIVTETAVAILQNSIGGGNFSATNPIVAASADAALVTAGNNFGIPASTIPVFDSANKTSDSNTLRLAALAVVANNQGTGATLADKVKALAQSMATLNAASAPADVVTQAAFDTAITTVTSGALSVAAAGATIPAAPTVKKFMQTNLAGTWDVHKITAGRTTVNTTTGAPLSSSSIWAHAAAIYDANGAPSTITFVNSSPLSGVATAPTFLVAADGTITDTANSSVHGTTSAGKDLAVITGTDFGDPELLIVQKRSAVTFSQSDLAGTWVAHRIQTGKTTVTPGTGAPLSSSNNWAYRVDTWDSTGVTNTPVSFLDSFNSTALGAPVNYVVAPDGTITVAANPSFHGTMSASKDLIVLTQTSNGDPRLAIFQKQVTGVNFSVADLAGTWDFHGIQAGRTTVNPTTGVPVNATNSWEHSVYTGDATGTITLVSTLDSAGNTLPGASINLVVAADGTVTITAFPSFHGTMSASKDFMVITNETGLGPDPQFYIAQKRK